MLFDSYLMDMAIMLIRYVKELNKKQMDQAVESGIMRLSNCLSKKINCVIKS